jgi:hypothetical protein
MIDPKMIPDEVVEAAARAIGEYYTSKEWFEIARGSRDVWHNAARAAIAAALTAWPGAYKSDPALFGHKLILPLTQEARDGE